MSQALKRDGRRHDYPEFGRRVQQGKFDPLAPLPVAEWQAADDPRAKLTCGDLLAMRGGLRWNESYASPDSDVLRMLFGSSDHAAVYAQQPAVEPPGEARRDLDILIDLARATGHSTPYVRGRLPLAFLAPRVQAAILDGRQPAEISVSQIIREDLPMDWAEQARIFGIG